MTKTRERMAYIAVSENKVKVGASFRPENRVAAISEWVPFPVKLMAVIPGGFEMESKLMRYFADSWFHSEWFHMSPKIQAVIDAVNRGELPDIPDVRPNGLHKGEIRRLKHRATANVSAAERAKMRRCPNWNGARPQAVTDAIASYTGVGKAPPSDEAMSVIRAYIAELAA